MRLIDADELIDSPIRVEGLIGGKYFVRAIPEDAIKNAPTIDAVPQWILVAERLPEENVDVWVTFREFMGYNSTYRYGTCKAIYIKERSIKVDDMWCYNECEELEIYDESEDSYYVKSGWYEIVENYDEYTHIYINAGIIAWMPLPKPYQAKIDEKDGE